jgi:hypothetical protein
MTYLSSRPMVAAPLPIYADKFFFSSPSQRAISLWKIVPGAAVAPKSRQM